MEMAQGVRENFQRPSADATRRSHHSAETPKWPPALTMSHEPRAGCCLPTELQATIEKIEHFGFVLPKSE
jgi:hypothetical protein